MTTDPREDLCKRRDAVLAKARTLAEKARDEGRELSGGEADDVNTALAEAKTINEKLAADERHKRIMGELDAQAASASSGLPGYGRRLAFGKSMASAAASKILPPGSSKALAPSGIAVVSQEFQPDPVALGRPANTLLSVMPVAQHTTPEFAYLRQTTRTNNAAVVAEGGTKPTSVLSVTRIEDSLDVVAHLSEAVPRYWFVDSPALQQFLTAELTYGLQVAVEAAALATINATSGIMTQAYSTSVLATLRKSLTTLEVQGYEAGFMLLNPSDWESVELALASTNAVEHLSLPYEPASRRLFGVPVVVSNAQAAGVSHAVGNGAVGLDTDTAGVQVAWSETSNATDWATNMIRCRVEGRFATSVFSPAAVVKGDLTA
jgi:HK97 family phage major capsid protein